MNPYSLAFDIISACWIIFVTVWVVTSVFTKRAVYRETTGRRMRYWLLLVTSYLLLANGRRLPYPLDFPVIPSTQLTAWIGACLCVAGFAFCVWARLTLGRNWSSAITLKADHELVERGPYGIVRHPIYTGLLAMYVGTAVALGHLGGVVGILLAFISFWIKLGDEENLMLQHFPEQYRAYRRRVKRIIPFVL